jgi:hypothetical protein
VETTCRGFDAASDTDAWRFVDVHDNFVSHCASAFFLGYNKQEYVKIHHNTYWNSVDSTSYQAGVILANSNPLKCTYSDNIIVDDRSVPAPVASIAAASGGSRESTTRRFRRLSVDQREQPAIYLRAPTPQRALRSRSYFYKCGAWRTRSVS